MLKPKLNWQNSIFTKSYSWSVLLTFDGRCSRRGSKRIFVFTCFDRYFYKISMDEDIKAKFQIPKQKVLEIYQLQSLYIPLCWKHC